MTEALTPMSPRRMQARMKLIRIMPRKDLEHLSRRPAPWHADRKTLEIEVANKWPVDEIEECVAKIMATAR